MSPHLLGSNPAGMALQIRCRSANCVCVKFGYSPHYFLKRRLILNRIIWRNCKDTAYRRKTIRKASDWQWRVGISDVTRSLELDPAQSPGACKMTTSRILPMWSAVRSFWTAAGGARPRQGRSRPEFPVPFRLSTSGHCTHLQSPGSHKLPRRKSPAPRPRLR